MRYNTFGYVEACSRMEVEHMPRKVSPLDADDIARRYRAGESGIAIAKDLGCDPTAVYYLLKRDGVAVRSLSEAHADRPRPNRRISLDDATIIDRYQRGSSLQGIADELGVSETVIRRRVMDAGIRLRTISEVRSGQPLPGKRIPIDIPAMIARYESGASVNGLAKEFGISRAGIVLRLNEAGLTPRNRHESMVERIRQTSDGERQRMTAHARNAGVASKETRLTHVGWGEDIVRDWLIARGVKPVQQLGFGPYNIDLAIEPIAVEIWSGPSHPLRVARSREKSELLINAGWTLIWIWVSRNRVLVERVADEVIAEIELARSNPSARGKQRVIRGNGHDAPIRERHPENIAIEPAA